jgi:hypothetical protein
MEINLLTKIAINQFSNFITIYISMNNKKKV